MSHPRPRVCIYCASSPGHDPAYLDAAGEMGAALAREGFDGVYGGGDRGLMGAVARAMIEGGAGVTGVIPRFLLDKERPDHGKGLELTELHVVDSMHPRKQMMFDLADAFLTLPGGIGTLEEVVEMMTWAQLGRHAKPIVLLDVEGFWAPLREMLERMDGAGFIHSAANLRPVFARTSGEAIEALKVTEPSSR